MTISCLIIDDEPLSQDVLKDYVKASPELQLVNVCNNALEAGNIIKDTTIDLLFLDINMPKLSGIGFIKSLDKPPLFVLITAYPEYAIEGFEVDAVDYLLKPVSFERFRKAINRVVGRMADSKHSFPDGANFIMVKANKKNYRVDFNELLFLEAMGDYVRFITVENSLMVHGKLKEFYSLMPLHQFIQVHKSYIINVNKITYIEGNQVKLAGRKIPVSLTYRDALFKVLGKNIH